MNWIKKNKKNINLYKEDKKFLNKNKVLHNLSIKEGSIYSNSEIKSKTINKNYLNEDKIKESNPSSIKNNSIEFNSNTEKDLNIFNSKNNLNSNLDFLIDKFSQSVYTNKDNYNFEKIKQNEENKFKTLKYKPKNSNFEKTKQKPKLIKCFMKKNNNNKNENNFINKGSFNIEKKYFTKNIQNKNNSVSYYKNINNTVKFNNTCINNNDSYIKKYYKSISKNKKNISYNYEKNQNWLNKKESSLSIKRKLKKNDELKNCTFKPKIKKSKNIQSKNDLINSNEYKLIKNNQTYNLEANKNLGIVFFNRMKETQSIFNTNQNYKKIYSKILNENN